VGKVLNSKGNHSHGQQHHPKLFWLGVALLVTFGIIVFLFLSVLQLQAEGRLRDSLEIVLQTTDNAMETWAHAEERNVTILAGDDDLRLSVEKQLRIGRDTQRLRASAPLKRIRNFLDPAIKTYRLTGFAIIAPNGVDIAALADDLIGTRDFDGHDSDLAKVMSGTVNLGLPYLSTLDLDPITHKQYPVMTFTAPIRNQAGDVIAALALRADPRLDFTATTHLARFEKTGDTYAFDRYGRLLTESRFDEQLQRAGILPSGAASILNVEVRDPGGNTLTGYRSKTPQQQEPLTRMAQSAVEGKAGIDVHGYRDYRGVSVIGAWLWDDQLKMGLATERDLSEAFRVYHHYRNLVLSVSFMTLTVGTVLLFILRHRDRLLASNEAYRQEMSARDDMMAIVAHDLKNPLNSMLLRSHVMLEQVAESSEAGFVRRNLELLQRTARQMNQLIGDLTDTAKIHAGRLHLERHECTLQQTVEPVIERMQLLSQEKKVEFTAHVPPDIFRLCVDQSRIIQVLDNLLGNALKFTPPGGKITLQVSMVDNEVRFAVTDTGPGIPGEASSRIFEPYWQVHETRTGMGLGLFIAKTIIEGHGGRISVESSVGQGTTFHFALPLIDKQDGKLTGAA
jgi:signal transduction histidine kinase